MNLPARAFGSGLRQRNRVELCTTPPSFITEPILTYPIIERGLAMQNPAKFREYAEECKKLAETAKPDHKAKLLEIAKAWEECARDLESRQRAGSAQNSHTTQ